ncbi:glycosyltransferase [archaeon]|nr:glycosyltransferase [archaeon]
MLSIIIPTYNEKDNIEKLISEIDSILKKRKISYEILVVDDSSPDGTADVVFDIAKKNKNVRLLVKTKKEGLGAAYKYAIPKAKGEIVMEMDADFSHKPKHIPEFIDAFENEKVQVVIGSRKVAGGKRTDSLIRQIYPAIGSLLFKIVGCPVRDPTSGFRAYRKKVLDKINLTKMPDDYSFQVAMIFTAKRNNAKIVEIPIVFGARELGETKYSNRDLFGNIKVLFDVILRRF